MPSQPRHAQLVSTFVACFARHPGWRAGYAAAAAAVRPGGALHAPLRHGTAGQVARHHGRPNCLNRRAVSPGLLRPAHHHLLHPARPACRRIQRQGPRQEGGACGEQQRLRASPVPVAVGADSAAAAARASGWLPGGGGGWPAGGGHGGVGAAAAGAPGRGAALLPSHGGVRGGLQPGQGAAAAHSPAAAGEGGSTTRLA